MIAVRLIIGAFALGLILSLPGAPGALAQGTGISLGVRDHDSSQPVEITSEELSVDQAGGTATFSGNVIVGQGDITMTCGTMRVEYGPDPDTGNNEIRVIRMSGGVTFVSKSDAAEANNAVYDLQRETLVMTGDVLVTQGTTALSSDKLTYNLQTGSGVMEGRVKTILQTGRN